MSGTLGDRILAARLVALGVNVYLCAGRAVVRRGTCDFTIVRPDGGIRVMRVGRKRGESCDWCTAAEWVVNELHWWGWL